MEGCVGGGENLAKFYRSAHPSEKSFVKTSITDLLFPERGMQFCRYVDFA